MKLVPVPRTVFTGNVNLLKLIFNAFDPNIYSGSISQSSIFQLDAGVKVFVVPSQDKIGVTLVIVSGNANPLSQYINLAFILIFDEFIVVSLALTIIEIF